MQGRETDLRNTLTQLETFIGGLDSQKDQINRALDSVNALVGHPRRADGDDRQGAGHHRARPRRAQPAARPARVDAAEPGQARRRRHPDHQPVRRRHRHRPAAAPADPQPAGRGRARPGQLAGPAADLPVPGQLAERAELPQGRQHRRVRAVHQHDGDAEPRPARGAVPLRDRPGDRRAEDHPAGGDPGGQLRPGRAPSRATSSSTSIHAQHPLRDPRPVRRRRRSRPSTPLHQGDRRRLRDAGLPVAGTGGSK